MSLVWKVGLESYRASGLQDLIVDETKHALAQLDRTVLTIGENGERPLGLLLLLLNLRQIRLWEREYQRNRLDLRDDHEPVGVCRMDDVPPVDLTDAGDTINRRRQSRVAKLHVRGVDERRIRFDSVLQLRHLCLLGVNQLRCGIAFAL